MIKKSCLFKVFISAALIYSVSHDFFVLMRVLGLCYETGQNYCFQSLASEYLWSKI